MWNTKLTIQSQHGREVLAVGHTSWICHTCLPQVGPEGSCGDDCPVYRGHLPVVRGQGGWHQDPPGDGQEEGDNLCCRVAHFLLWLGGLRMGQEERSLPRECHKAGGRVGPGQVRHQNPASPSTVRPSIGTWEPPLVTAYHSLTHNHLLCIVLAVVVVVGVHTAAITPHFVQEDLQGEEAFNWKDLKSLWQRRSTRWGAQIGEIWMGNEHIKLFLCFKVTVHKTAELPSPGFSREVT